MKHEWIIVKSRVKALADSKGKMLSTDFLLLIDNEVRELVSQACHNIGEKRLVKGKEFQKSRAFLNSLNVSPKNAAV